MNVTEAASPKGFAERLRAALKHADMTQDQLATKLAARAGSSVARTTVTHWCTSRSEPDRDQIEVIAEETGVAPAWLAWGHGEMTADIASANAETSPIDGDTPPEAAA